ncbi:MULTISPECIES: DUF2786 domain-containing protein [Actinobacillus]|uniref:DUF2786 domain-containing protein n=1 Tax=Actinobacillus TaxID=713 RepID=UPI00123FDCDB|nr:MULTISPECIES: DUF2786 domain-containing protein [Actinobacillus]MDG4949144.1 DUF2786 domain-containing protein [Actinobacillus equuli subsp. haemolyticus]MDG4949165.1 DUF2786 domain-containing protein [Actinobacillus equuli subsp. haemolyticus]MDG4949276.1 DUF2786 domain-containing protein [Actinobacillus equuli subsp. haemolyticus]
MDNQKLLEKIKKLLALSKSPNIHEATRALEMAQKLMKKHKISRDDVEISENTTEVSFAKRTPVYVHNLVAIIKRAFGCEAYLLCTDKAKAIFFGQEERPEIAAYCFDVLYRKLAIARKAFTATQSKRLKRSTLIARADAFCEGWTEGVYRNVKDFAMTPEEKGKIERHFQHLKQKFNMGTNSAREAGDTRERNGDVSRWQGYQAGKKVELNHGVNGKESLKLGAM